MSDDMQTITEQAAKDARDVFESYGSKAREAIDYMEQLIYASLRKSEPIEDMRAAALREAADLMDRRNRGDLPAHILSEDGNAIRALIPEVKP